MRKLLFVSALLLMAAAQTLAQQTQPGLNSEIQTQLPSGAPGGISALTLRGVLTDMVSAIFQTPVGSVLITASPCTADPTGVTDSTAAINACEALRPVGSTMVWPAGTYKITDDITSQKAGLWSLQGAVVNSNAGRFLETVSNFVIDGTGTSTFNFTAGNPAFDKQRAIRVQGGGFSATGTGPNGDFTTTGNIAVGATSFVAGRAQDAATVSNGDWVVVYYFDPTNVIQSEYKQVISVTTSTTINVSAPFAQPFTNGSGNAVTPCVTTVSPAVSCWPVYWAKLLNPIYNVGVRNLNINLPSATSGIGIDAQPSVINPIYENNVFNIFNGLATFAYGQVNFQYNNNLILNEGTRHSEFSEMGGGRIGGNIYKALDGSNGGGPTINTGSFGMLVDHNQIIGRAASGLIVLNDTSGNIVDHNLYICPTGSTGLTIDGGSNNTVTGDTYFNCTEGVEIVADRQIISGGSLQNGTLQATGNAVSNVVIRNATNGVHAAEPNTIGTLFIGIDTDSSVSTPIVDNGTGTNAFFAGTQAGIPGWHVNGDLTGTGVLNLLNVNGFINLGTGTQIFWPNIGSAVLANAANFIVENQGSGALILDSTGAAGQFIFRTTGPTLTMDFGQTNANKWTFAGSPFMPGLITTAAAPTVAAAQIGYGSTTVAAGASTGGGTCPTGVLGGGTVAGCIIVNIAGTARGIPFF